MSLGQERVVCLDCSGDFLFNQNDSLTLHTCPVAFWISWRGFGVFFLCLLEREHARFVLIKASLYSNELKWRIIMDTSVQQQWWKVKSIPTIWNCSKCLKTQTKLDFSFPSPSSAPLCLRPWMFRGQSTTAATPVKWVRPWATPASAPAPPPALRSAQTRRTRPAPTTTVGSPVSQLQL